MNDVDQRDLAFKTAGLAFRRAAIVLGVATVIVQLAGFIARHFRVFHHGG